jgi:uncharacterized membrane protein
MYSFILALHNILRWLILVAAVVVIVQAFVGWFGKKEWSKADNLAGIIYVSAVDLNVLLGLILYLFLSPLTRQAFADFGAAMGNPVLRFFAVEHILMMLVALALAHVGRSLSKKATETVKKHRPAAIWYTLSLLAILSMIPWDRSLWPGVG